MKSKKNTPANFQNRFFKSRLIILMTLFIFSLPAFAQNDTPYPTLQKAIKSPPVKGKDENGKTVSLLKIKSRLTLIYFYQVNCHLCDVVTPELKKLYDSYHKLGLELVAVPVESGMEEWKQYVKEKSLSWKNVFLTASQMEKVKSDYKLTVYPTIYLLDKNKILLTERMMRASQVEEELNTRIR